MFLFVLLLSSMYEIRIDWSLSFILKLLCGGLNKVDMLDSVELMFIIMFGVGFLESDWNS